MDIGPIAGIRVTPVMKLAPVEPKFPAVFEVEALARPVDDTWSGDSRNAPADQDDQGDELNLADQAELSGDPRRVDFFA